MAGLDPAIHVFDPAWKTWTRGSSPREGRMGWRRCKNGCTSIGRDMENRNPRTIEEARALVAQVEALFMPWDIPALLAGFTDDCVVRFGDLPEFQGKVALEDLFRRRSERQIGYRLKKELRAFAGDTLANYWQGEWRDRDSGKRMQGRGVEIWIMRDGLIAVWEAAFNANEIGAASAMGVT